MPQGVVATVDGGFATLDFVDTSLRGPALNKLLEIGGPGTIETITRRGPRRQYRVPEGNAREAGLLDDDAPNYQHSAGVDTGAAAALEASGGNVNPGEHGEDWHTPTAEHTSANAYVAQERNEPVLQARLGAASPTTANQNAETGEGFGGSASPTPHSDLISHVKDNSSVRAVGGTQEVRTPDPEKDWVNPGAAANLGLADQYGAHASDPGATPTEGGEARTDEIPPARTSQVASDVVNPFAKADPRPDGLPEGEPDESWRRPELDAYAQWKGIKNIGTLTNKAAVLEAIAKQRETGNDQ